MIKTELKDDFYYTTSDVKRFDEEGNELPNLLQVATGREYFDAYDKEKADYVEITEIEKESEKKIAA